MSTQMKFTQIIQFCILVAVLFLLLPAFSDSFKIVNETKMLHHPITKSDINPRTNETRTKIVLFEIGNMIAGEVPIVNKYDLDKGDNKTSIQTIKIIYEYYNGFSLAIVTLIFTIALDIRKLGAVFRRPFGPLISIFCNYIFSPLVRNYFI